MSSPLLRLDLRASPVLTLLTLAAHGLAAAVLAFMLPPVPGMASGVLVCLLGVTMVWQYTLLRSSGSVQVLCLKGDGSLTVQLRNGRELKGVPAARRYVNRWMVVLDLQGHRPILLARDMLDREAFRQLRLWTLWQALPAIRSVPPDPSNALSASRTN